MNSHSMSIKPAINFFEENQNIEIARKELKRTDKNKFHDVLINIRLSIKNLVSSIQNLVSMATGMLNRVSTKVPVEVKLTL